MDVSKVKKRKKVRVVKRKHCADGTPRCKVKKVRRNKAPKGGKGLREVFAQIVASVVEGRDGVADVPDACLDTIAEMLHGLNLAVLGTLVPQCTVHLPLHDTPQAFSSATGHAVYSSAPGSILAMPTPTCLTEALFDVFNSLPYGTTLIGIDSRLAVPTSSLLLVKSSAHTLHTYTGMKLLITQLDGSASWNNTPLEPGKVMFVNDGSSLSVSTEEGCAAIVIAWKVATLGLLTEKVVMQGEQMLQGMHNMSYMAKALDPLASFNPEYSSVLIALATEHKVNPTYQAAGSPCTRQPLLRGTLHANVTPLEYLQQAAAVLDSEPLSLESLKMDKDAATAADNFIAKGVLWAQVEGSAKLVDSAHASIMRRAAAEDKTNDLTMSSMVEGERYFPVHYRKHRQDIGQNLDGGHCELLMKAVLQEIGGFLHKVLGNARLVELSCLLSHPGSLGQPPHSDSTSRTLASSSNAHLISCFVPLVDVEEDMGPLEVWPRTHSIVQLLPNSISLLGSESGNQHQEFLSEGEELASQNTCPITSRLVYPSNKMMVPKGSVVMMDSRCYHRGSANVSKTTRPVFYFTFASEGGELPEGSTYSLVDSLKRRSVRLGDLMPLPRPLPAPYKQMKRCELPNSLKADLFLHLNDFCTPAIISRVKPSSKRGSQEDDADNLYDAIVQAQEICIAANAGGEPGRGVLAAFKWLKAEAARNKQGEKEEEPLGLIINGGLIMASSEAAKAASASGVSVVLRARPELHQLLWGGRDKSTNAPLLDACVDNTTHVLLLHKGAQSHVMYNSDFGVVLPQQGSISLTVWDSETGHATQQCGVMDPPPRYSGSREVFSGRLGTGVFLPPRCYFQITSVDETITLVTMGTHMQRAFPVILHSAKEVTQSEMRQWKRTEWRDFSTVRALASPEVVPPLVCLVTKRVVKKHERAKAEASTPLVLNPCAVLQRVDVEDLHSMPRVAVASRVLGCAKHLADGALSGTVFKLTIRTPSGTHESLLVSEGPANSVLDDLSTLIARDSWCDTAGLPLPLGIQSTLEKEHSLRCSLLDVGVVLKSSS